MEQTVDIFYIATGEYNTYFSNFYESVGNFLPGWHKRIHVITDWVRFYEDNFINNEAFDWEKDREIDVHYQLDLPYPIIPLLKTTFVKAYMTDDMDYVFYFDADTYFINRGEEYWREFVADIESGQIIASSHPGDYHPKYTISDESEAKIPEGRQAFQLISSMWGGRADSVRKLCDQMGEKIRKDLNYHKDDYQCHYIPSLFDQDYFNKVVYESKGLSFLIKNYVYIRWFVREDEDLTRCLVEQKYDIQRKFKKKNMENV